MHTYYKTMHRLLLLWEKEVDINLPSTHLGMSLATLIIAEYVRLLNQEIFADISVNTQEEVIQLITDYTNIYALMCEKCGHTIEINKTFDCHNNTYVLATIKLSIEHSHTFASQINGFITHFIRTFRNRIDPYAQDHKQQTVFDICTVQEHDTQERIKNKQCLAALLKKHFTDRELCITKKDLEKLHNCNFSFI